MVRHRFACAKTCCEHDCVLAKTDAAIVTTFYDPKKENIGTRVLVLKDIEPKTVRPFRVRFKPQEGDTVRSFSIALGDIAV